MFVNKLYNYREEIEEIEKYPVSLRQWKNTRKVV